MASKSSFDVTSQIDLQEVDNAVQQARKEVGQRYDFRGAVAEIEFDRGQEQIVLTASDDYKLKALVDVLESKLTKRGVPLRNLRYEKQETASGGAVRQEVKLQLGVPTETGKKIVRSIKDAGFKKVQAQIQEDQVRVTSPSIDELQEVIAHLKQEDFELELQFGNFRS